MQEKGRVHRPNTQESRFPQLRNRRSWVLTTPTPSPIHRLPPTTHQTPHHSRTSTHHPPPIRKPIRFQIRAVFCMDSVVITVAWVAMQDVAGALIAALDPMIDPQEDIRTTTQSASQYVLGYFLERSSRKRHHPGFATQSSQK